MRRPTFHYNTDDHSPEGNSADTGEMCGDACNDSDHQLYFLPYKGDIFISDVSMSRFRKMQANTPLEGKDAMFMIEDKEGWLWIATNNGLYRYDKKDTFIPYSFADGYRDRYFWPVTR